MLILDGSMSFFLLRGDTEIECLHEELADDTFDDDDRVFLSRVMFMALLIMPCYTNSQTTLTGVPHRHKNVQRKYMEWQKL
jgi:hypothetical protein